MFTKYGYNTIGITAILSFLLIVLGIFFNNNIAKYGLFAVAIFLISFTLYFFRDPDRKPPAKDGIVVSPCFKSKIPWQNSLCVKSKSSNDVILLFKTAVVASWKSNLIGFLVSII